jgi:hypothetical protein
MYKAPAPPFAGATAIGAGSDKVVVELAAGAETHDTAQRTGAPVA